MPGLILNRFPRARWGLLAPVGLALIALGLGCRAIGSAPPPRALPVAAERAFAEAMLHFRDYRKDAAERAREAAQRAVRLAPDWVAPRRLIDDIDRSNLIGPELLERYEARLVLEPDHAPTLYLAGRLDGSARAEKRFRAAIDANSSLSWAHHGLAWTRAMVGDRRGGVNAQRRALTYARGSWERSYFTEALARRHLARGKDVIALDVLLERLAEEDVFPTDRLALGVRAALIGLSLPFGKRSREGATRALKLLRQGGLTESEAAELTGALLNARATGNRVGLPEILLSLRAVDGPGRDRLAAGVMLQESKTPLALGLLKRSLGSDTSALALSPQIRSARFAIGELEEVLEQWLELQPAFVLDSAGLPRDAELRAMILAGRRAGRSRSDGEHHVADLKRFGEALIEAGWFVEARGLAEGMAALDLDMALELDHRATAGRALIESFVDLVERVDNRQPIRILEPELAQPSKEVARADLDQLLLAMEPRFRQFKSATGRITRSRDRDLGLANSPRIRFGPVGSIVHPGPTFSAMDQELGLGRAGEPVAGLAAEFDAIGRFAVFGEAMGGHGPDGTVLRKLLVEDRKGSHFGTEWSGTVAWCDGADLRSRPGRRGARIGGAALHEGYWIDVETLRGEARVYRALQNRFLGAGAEAALDRALSVSPLKHVEGGSTERPPLLGEGNRVRLALMRERASGSIFPTIANLGKPSLTKAGTRHSQALVPLEELIETTATHEEGHLCDRARFLPLSQKLWSVALFFISSGMSASRVEERLEYRAQLTSLCDTPETRLPLAEILTAAELGVHGVTPHGAAYTRLLEDFLAELQESVDENPELWPQLDPEAFLAHQLHRLNSQQVRVIALQLAVKEGLLDS